MNFVYKKIGILVHNGLPYRPAVFDGVILILFIHSKWNVSWSIF